MASAADGTATCTLPVISPTSYGVCISNNLSTTENASSYCATTLGPLTGDGSIIAFVNCVGDRMYSPPPAPMTAISWKPDGASDATAANLCGPYSVVWRYGIEMRGFDRQELYYSIFPTRWRFAECPYGYTAVGANLTYPDYCIKPACERCQSVGNPLTVATGEKLVFETDYQARGASPLEFKRAYSSLGYYRPINGAYSDLPGFGGFWRHTYDRRIYAESSAHLMATAVRHNGTEKHSRADGKDVLNQDGGRDTLQPVMQSGQLVGWEYRVADGALETYDASGALTSIRDARGRTQTLTYSDTTTPPNIAPSPGLLIAVTDQFGRSLNFTYGSDRRMQTMTAPDGGVYSYVFGDKEMLTRVTHPDNTFRTYQYNDTGFATAGGPYAISGITDESNARFATYRYRDAYWNTPDSTEHGTGVEKFSRYPGSGNDVAITDPLGTTRTYFFSTINGVRRLVSQSQPAGSGCNASSRALSHDARGNATSVDDFNGRRTCIAYESERNFESARVEGLPNTALCSDVTLVGAALPAGSRRISTSWHPDWHLKTQSAEPGKRTYWVYNGQPDPFNGNAIANCAPATAVLPDGKPIVVLCKQVEQATTDLDGRLGFAAAAQSNVAIRQWSWSYNAYGQVLTSRGPRTDVNDTTTYIYYTDTTADHTFGDLQSATNAAGLTIEYPLYDKHGQALRMVDANGVVTDYTYDQRQRVASVTADGRSTAFAYYPTGLLRRTTQPDDNFVEYIYDDAHRLIALSDSLGNRIDYTLDNMGNRTAEKVKDPSGALARQVTRIYDALGRVRQTTGRE